MIDTLEADFTYWVNFAATFRDPAKRESVLRAGVTGLCPHCHEAERRQTAAAMERLRDAARELHEAVKRQACADVKARIARAAA